MPFEYNRLHESALEREIAGDRDQEDIVSGAVPIRPGQAKLYKVVSAHESDLRARINLNFNLSGEKFVSREFSFYLTITVRADDILPREARYKIYMNNELLRMEVET